MILRFDLNPACDPAWVSPDRARSLRALDRLHALHLDVGSRGDALDPMRNQADRHADLRYVNVRYVRY